MKTKHIFQNYIYKNIWSPLIFICPHVWHCELFKGLVWVNQSVCGENCRGGE